MAKTKKLVKGSDETLVQRLEKLCVDIFAHDENDYEIGLSGNGTNSAEASNVAMAILDILYGDGRKWASQNNCRIEKRAAELRREIGDED